MIKRKDWEAAEDRILLRAIEAGCSFSTVGSTLDRTKDSCISRWHRLNPEVKRSRKRALTPALPLVDQSNELIVESVPGSLLPRVKWLEKERL